VGLAKINGAVAPVGLKRLAADGTVVAEIVPTDFTAVDSAVGPLPLQLHIRAFEADGKTVMESTIAIRDIEVNRPIDPRVFTIDWQDAKAVWDSDAGAFVKHSDPQLVNVPLEQFRRQKRHRG
jgi:hypothetical protein